MNRQTLNPFASHTCVDNPVSMRVVKIKKLALFHFGSRLG